MSYLTDRKRATGRGSGREGTHHHWQMMVSSTLLVFAVPAFVLIFGLALGGSFEQVQAFFSRPGPAIICGLSLVVIINHLRQEALMAVEDYIHGVTEKLSYMAVNALAYVLMAVGVFALLKMAL